MTALSDNRATNKYDPSVAPEFIVVNMAASTKIYKGALVGVDVNGRAVAGTSVASSRIIGRAEEYVDNSSGAADAKTIKIRQGVYYLANSATTDAITAADIGRECYAVDDQTVARTPSNGAYARAGIVVNVDSSLGVAVWIGAPVINSAPVDMTFVTGEDLSSYQYSGVKLNSSGVIVRCGAGEFPLGILQNAPGSGAVGVVRLAGVSLMKADGTGVTRGDKISCAANGLGRASTAVGTGALAYVVTNDTGVAQDPVVAASIIGLALTTGAASANFYVLITQSGAVGATAA